MCSGYDIFGLESFFFALSHTADVLCIEVHKEREKVRGAERCYESELCLCVIRGVFIPPILLKNVS